MMGNPIHGGTGNKHEWEEDFLGGGARPLRVERSYNSQMEEDGGLGIGWRTGWSGQAITVLGSPATGAFADRPDGKRYLFRLVSGAWKPDADIVDRLERLTDAGGNTAGWRYTSAGGEIETYTASGALTSFADGRGWTWSVATTGTTTTVTDPAGRAMMLGVDAAGNRTVTLPDGGIITYRKDANNNLVSVTYPDNSIKQYLYEDSRFPHALTGLIDENGDRYASWSYGADGRAIASWHGGALYADQTVLTYNSDGSTGVNDALGSVRTYGFTPVLGVPRTTGSTQPAGSGCGAASSGVSYDANGNMSTRTDFNGNQTQYTYDLARNLETRRVEGLSGTGTATAATRTISTQWHPDWRLASRIAEPLRITTLVYNGQPDPTSGNAVLSCAPPTALVNGRPIAVLCRKIEQATADTDGSAGFAASPLPGAASTRVWNHTYNSHGQLTATVSY